MSEIRTLLDNLRRPRLLVRAARHGLQDYRRERDLARLIGRMMPAAESSAVPRLIEAEAEIEEVRRAGAAGYSIARHVELLIALMAEARLFAAPLAR